MIDILDFGIFIGQYINANNPGTNSPCGVPGFHADSSGNGFVDVADFTFIQINFLHGNEAACCTSAFNDHGGGGGVLASDGNQQPITRISVRELHRRGRSEAVAGDLNRDGWLDAADMQTFATTGGP